MTKCQDLFANYSTNNIFVVISTCYTVCIFYKFVTVFGYFVQKNDSVLLFTQSDAYFIFCILEFKAERNTGEYKAPCAQFPAQPLSEQ